MAALLVIMASTTTLTAAGTAHADPGPAVAQPMPPLPVLSLSDAGYISVGASQKTVADGAMATVTVGKPIVSADDSHSLASVAVRSADKRHNVQIGWTVDRELNGDDEPHLFVIHRADGVDACYNICGFEPYAPSTVQPGAALPAGTSKRFIIQHSGDRWWVGYDTQWLGSFPDSLWAGAFTYTGAVHYFGEVSGTGDPSCSQMGTGSYAESTQAARFSSISLINGTPAALVPGPPDPFYGYYPISAGSFRFGGPGLC
ncbi:neprosin family prolyl endopeptidase [Actinoplanes sp. GCM10030250]|uniref:neprosin family prolyl endopeptidase n=1 Tax=Actinoplanes sp. GCM10030250 TaxID=3273376 RepID=UPI00360BD80E